MDDYVSELMSTDVITARDDLSLENLRFKMRSRSVHAVPVVDEAGRPIGIVSTTDLLEDHPHGTPVGRIMTKRVFTVPRYADVREAARIMYENRIHHLVVTEENLVVGVLSTFDLLRAIESNPGPEPRTSEAVR